MKNRFESLAGTACLNRAKELSPTALASAPVRTGCFGHTRIVVRQIVQLVAIVFATTFVSVSHAGAVSGQGTWESNLQARDLDGDGTPDAFYDVAQDITWLRTGSASNMYWDAAKAWASQDHFGISGWRLPSVTDYGQDGCPYFTYAGGPNSDCAYNPDPTGSELAHLFYVSLGNIAYCAPSSSPDSCVGPQSGWGLSNTGLFIDLRPVTYWSGTEYVDNVHWYWSEDYSTWAWNFSVEYGYQGAGLKTYYEFGALAVRDGDVLANIPEPDTLCLLMLSLACLGASRRCRSV